MMKKSIKFKIETQTQDNDVIAICHLNERTIALELSDIARKMFVLNRTLFDKINSSTKLLGGSIYREQITKSKQDTNGLGVKLLDKYEHDDVKIISLQFSNNFLQRRQSILLKNGRRITFDPKALRQKEYPGPLDPQRLTFDDVSVATKVCEVHEIDLFQDVGVKTFMLKDYMEDAESLYEVAYRIEINATTKFEDYVNFVVAELEKSSIFMLSYLNSASSPFNYNSKILDFEKQFSKSILNQLGISDSTGNINLASNRIKNSEFGRAALNYYNGLLLTKENVSKSIYSEFLKGVLPTSKSSKESIENYLRNINSLINTIRREYNIYNKDSKSSDIQLKVVAKKNNIKNFSVATTEKINLDKELLGYNIFSEKQRGLIKLSPSTYRRRVQAERTKYYPSRDIVDDTSFLTPKERAVFSSDTNSLSYLTPVSLIMGKKVISCSRGMSNIDVNDIRQFRLAKSARAMQQLKTIYPEGLRNAKLSQNVMSSFNITIGQPRTSILERPTVSIVLPIIDVKYYVGETSFFATDRPDIIFKNFKKLMEREDRRVIAVVSDAVPASFLRQSNTINSIEELNLSNKNSKLRALVSGESINFDEIPPHIKAMMGSAFQTNPNIDPLKNRESRAIIDETQKNIFLIRALTGFELDEDGFHDLNRPVHIDMKDDLFDGKPMLAKAYNYEIPELGIVKDKFMPTIYNNLLYIRG